ncbi:MAG: MHYT domain-containing protein, partial [Stenotrophomonas koreensis]
MSGSYSLSLVVVSFLIAVLASYTALNMVARLAQAPHGEARWRLLGGTLALGLGVWSMHLLGTQAYSLPIALGYDPGLTVMSLAAALAAAAWALWLSTRQQLRWPALLGGGLVMTSGIGASHYLGMAALRMQP